LDRLATVSEQLRERLIPPRPQDSPIVKQFRELVTQLSDHLNQRAIEQAIAVQTQGDALLEQHAEELKGDRVRSVAADAEEALELVRVGSPVNGCEIRIADAAGSAVDEGTVGRILIRGDNVSPGYYLDPALTAAAHTADGFLDTGDLGTLHYGELIVTGRIKEILFVAGQNHYPQDIELVLAQHAGIELGRAAAAGTRPAHAATDDILVFVLSKGDDLAPFAEVARTVRRVVNERMGLAVAAVVPVRQFPKTTSG
jgi:acyl-CoA synthetase (AMP-forming)/AMP-acid ligase II